MLKDLVKKSRSYRGFDESHIISREVLTSLVDLARLCPASVNVQPLKYYLSCDSATNAIIQPLTGWAKALKNTLLPKEGQMPTAFIVICCDTSLGDPARYMKDVGIVAQTMLLGATELGLGGCMIGSFSAEKVAGALGLADSLVPVLIVALGKPIEQIVLVDVKDGNTSYYRDENDIHYVPKRALSEIII